MPRNIHVENGRRVGRARRDDRLRAETGYDSQGRRDPLSNFWYGPVDGGSSDAGVAVTPDSAMKVAAVFRAVSIIANSVAQLPLRLYRDNDDGTRTPVRKHRLLDVLEGRPNERHSPWQFKQLITGWTALRGNGLAEIVGSPQNGFLDHLEPLIPTRLSPARLLPTGRLAWTYHPLDGSPPRTLTQDQVFNVAGLSTDGIEGLSIVGAMRQACGISLGAERMAGQQMGRAPRMAGILQSTKSYKDETVPKRMAESFRAANSGANANGVAVLEEGTTWISTGMTNKDAEFVASREFEVVEFARFSGVPPALLFSEIKGSGLLLEQLVLSFLMFGLMPWLETIEGAIERDLIVEPGLHAEFDPRGLLRGDTAAMTAYWTAATGRRAWARPNEARVAFGLDPDTSDPELDKIHEGLGDTHGVPKPDAQATGADGGSAPRDPNA